MQRRESFVYLQNETLIEEKKTNIYRKIFLLVYKLFRE